MYWQYKLYLTSRVVELQNFHFCMSCKLWKFLPIVWTPCILLWTVEHSLVRRRLFFCQQQKVHAFGNRMLVTLRKFKPNWVILQCLTINCNWQDKKILQTENIFIIHGAYIVSRYVNCDNTKPIVNPHFRP